MRLSSIAFLFALVGLVLAFAQSTAATAPPSPLPPNVAELAAVVVSGVQPGPGLWKVSTIRQPAIM